MSVQPIPKGYHSITPFLVVNDAAKAIDFYRRAFGAKEISRMDGPDGKVAHAEIQIGDSRLMLSDESPRAGIRTPKSLGGSTVNIFLYVDNVDSVFKQAESAGAKVDMPLENMFWGDRYGKLMDPFGHSWSVATHREDVSPDEMKKRMQQAAQKQKHEAHAQSFG